MSSPQFYKMIPPGPKPVGFGRFSNGVTVVAVVVREPGGPQREFQRNVSGGGVSRIEIADASIDPCGQVVANAAAIPVSFDLTPQHISDLNATYASIPAAGGIRGIALRFSQSSGLADGDWKALRMIVGQVGSSDSIEEIHAHFQVIL